MFAIKPGSKSVMRILFIVVMLLSVLLSSTAIAMSSPDTSNERGGANLQDVTPTPYPLNPLYFSLADHQLIAGIADSREEDIIRYGNGWSVSFTGRFEGIASTDLVGIALVDGGRILMAFSSSVTLLNGLAVTPQDIVRYEGSADAYSLVFDGSDVGLDDTTNEKIDAVAVLPDGSLLISTTGNPVVPGVSGAKDEDLLAFTPTSQGEDTAGTWSMYFDGSDVGLGDLNEDIDGADVANGKIYLSTRQDFSVPGVSGANEDVFVCEIVSTGNSTACNYQTGLYFDGSLRGMDVNDLDALHYYPYSDQVTPTPTPTSSSPGDSVTFIPEIDSYVSEAAPTKNYGIAGFVQADGTPGDTKISYLRFNVSGIPSSIQSVKLRLYCEDNATVNGPAVYLADNNWIESGTGGVNWNTRPPLISGEIANTGAISAGTWVEYDVTAAVTGDGTYTFALVGDHGDGVTFTSSRFSAAWAPKLIVSTLP